MRSILIFICVMFYISANAQSIEYKLIKKAIEHKWFDSHFRVSKRYKEVSLYNRAKVNLDSNTFKLGNSIITISNDSAYEKLRPSNSGELKHPNLLILSLFEKKGNEYKMFFWQPSSNNSVQLIYKTKGKRIKFVGGSYGVF